MDEQFPHVFGSLLFHPFKDFFSPLFGEIAQKISRIAGRHLLHNIRCLLQGSGFDQGLLNLRINLLEGFSRCLGVQGMEDGGAFSAAQVLDDIRQIRRMKVRQFLLRDTEMEQVRAGEELNIFPGDKLIGKLVGEEPLEYPIGRPLPSHPPHQSPESHIDMNQPQPGLNP